MKLIAVILFAACLQVSARGYSQITLSENNALLQKVFKEIQKQSGYDFVCTYEILKEAGKVSVNVRDVSLQKALEECLKGKPLTYVIIGKTVVVQSKEKDYYNAVNNSIVLEPLPPPPVEIHGKVVNKQGEPLQNVSVLIAGTQIGTTTNSDGRFTLTAPDNRNIVFEVSSVGYQTKRVSVGKQTEVNVTLELEVAGLSDVVVVGYGTQRKSSLTSSISKIQNDNLDQVPAGRTETALIGRIAGVNISTLRNTPGAAPEINVRGFGSISGGNTPLIVIDGFPGGDLGQLDMNDVESIEVLKDASSAAIYGSRGSGGVILVTTKRGKSGKPVLSLNSYYGFTQPMMFNDWMTGEEWYNYLVKYQNREFLWNGGDVSLPMFGDSRRPIKYQVNPLTKELPQTVWQDASTQTGIIQNHNLSIKGGSENVRYYVSGTYSSEDGAVRTAHYNTYSFRANLDVKINKVISLGMELTPFFTKRRDAGTNMTSLSKYPPFVGTKRIDGRYPLASDYIPFGHSKQANPLTYLYGTKDYNNSFTNLARAFINISLLDGLSLKTSIATNLNYSTNNVFIGGDGDPNVKVNGSVGQSQGINIINENVLSYTKLINEVHDISGIIGASYQDSKSQNFSMNAVTNSFNNQILETLNNAVINPSTSTQTKTQWGLISYFGRLNYGYKDKYLLSASIRTDGSSRFGTDNKWGTFPSVSAAWRISKERFMENISSISELKLRGSYGVTGNFNIGNFQYLGAVGKVFYSPDNETVNATTQTSIENQNLSWEKSKGYDLGIELGLFANRLKISFDYYDKTTTDMLYAVNVPAITGFTSTIENLGSVNNRGIDVEITTRNMVNSFRWNTSFNFSTNKNTVEDIGGVDERINTKNSMNWLLRKGEPMFSFYGYKIVGIFQNADQISKLPHLAATKPGNPIVKDVNGDGEINPNDDMVILGNFQPKVLLGMSNDFFWKKFDLSIFVQASLGAKIFNYEQQSYEGNTMGAMPRSLAVNQWWSEDDPGDGITPAAALSQLFSFNTNTDYYIEDASYLNIRNINLGYNLSTLVKPTGIRSLRVYASVANLLIIRNKGNHAFNPEGATGGSVDGINSTPGYNAGTEPINRTIVLGVNIGF